MGSEMTAAAVGGAGQVRRDPMAMLPFCGYHMGDYFRHWINMHKTIKHPPRNLSCQLVPQERAGRIPLAWLRREYARTQMDRGSLPRPHGCSGNRAGLGTRPNSLDLDGLNNFPPERLEQIQAIDEEEWRREILMQDELFMKLHARLPKELIFQRELLLARL